MDDYLATCAEIGRDPDKPYSGRFVVRVSPEAHRLAETAARAAGKSPNGFVAEALERVAREHGLPAIDKVSFIDTIIP